MYKPETVYENLFTSTPVYRNRFSLKLVFLLFSKTLGWDGIYSLIFTGPDLDCSPGFVFSGTKDGACRHQLDVPIEGPRTPLVPLDPSRGDRSHTGGLLYRRRDPSRIPFTS